MIEDTIDELCKEATEMDYRLKAVEDELRNLSKIDLVEEVKELKELVKYILERIKPTPQSNSK